MKKLIISLWQMANLNKFIYIFQQKIHPSIIQVGYLA